MLSSTLATVTVIAIVAARVALSVSVVVIVITFMTVSVELIHLLLFVLSFLWHLCILTKIKEHVHALKP